MKLVSSKGRKIENKKPNGRIEQPRQGVSVEQPRQGGRVEQSRQGGRTEQPRQGGRVKQSRPGAKIEQRKPGVKTARKRSGGKTALLIFLILLLGIAALIVSLGFYVNSLDTVYPNVWADGVKLSGMTLEEAVQALISAGYEGNTEGVSATVSFPNGINFVITGDEAGLSLSADDAAAAAFEFGRSGTFFEKEVAFINALLSRTDLRDLSVAKMDTELVRDIVSVHTRMFNDEIIKDAYTIGAKSITVVKGTGVEPAAEEDVFELTITTLVRAMEEQTHLTAHYTPTAAAEKDVDLELLLSVISVEAVESVYDPATFSATESSTGVTFDIDAARAMLNKAGNEERIVIPLITTEPETTQEYLESMLFRDLLSERTTRIAGTSNRLNNIVLSATAIDETLLNPGDLFSFNEIVGRRTAERGYREAGAYVGGRTVQEIGGGICQTSSTIYDTVLHADLQVVERRNHGFIVTYLPLGNDATVSWGAIDFKFRNSTDYPIRIEATVNGRDLTVKLIGTKLDDTYIKIDYDHISSTPFQIIRKEDESVPQGQTITDTDGFTGHVVDTYKSIFDGEGNLISRTLVGRSTYRVQDRVILIPVPLPPDETGATDPDTTTTTNPPPDTPDNPPVDNPGNTPGEPDDPPEDPPNESSSEPSRQEPDGPSEDN